MSKLINTVLLVVLANVSYGQDQRLGWIKVYNNDCLRVIYSTTLAEISLKLKSVGLVNSSETE